MQFGTGPHFVGEFQPAKKRKICGQEWLHPSIAHRADMPALDRDGVAMIRRFQQRPRGRRRPHKSGSRPPLSGSSPRH
jgi:hypothetical protein